MVVGDPLEILLKGIVLDQDSMEIHNLEMLETDPTGGWVWHSQELQTVAMSPRQRWAMKPAVHAPRPTAMIKERGRPPANNVSPLTSGCEIT